MGFRFGLVYSFPPVVPEKGCRTRTCGTAGLAWQNAESPRPWPRAAAQRNGGTQPAAEGDALTAATPRSMQANSTKAAAASQPTKTHTVHNRRTRQRRSKRQDEDQDEPSPYLHLTSITAPNLSPLLPPASLRNSRHVPLPTLSSSFRHTQLLRPQVHRTTDPISVRFRT